MRPILIVLSLLAAAVAVYFAFSGYNTAYADLYGARVVGGDAYNFIIAAGRGTAKVSVGVVAGLLSCTFAVLAMIAGPSPDPPKSPE